MRYLIFLDIDGTILPRDTQIIPRCTIDAIEKAKEQGHMVFINTGRSKNFLPKYVVETVKPTGIVGGLGTWIKVGEEILLSEAVPKEQVVYALEIAKKFNNRIVLEGENYCVSCYGRFFDDERYDLSSPEEIYERYPDIRVSKMTFERPFSEEEVRLLSKYFTVYNNPTYGEIGLPEYSKATGMEFLSRRFGIDREHIIAMGDSENDELMLKAAGIAVVMGDGSPAVKKIADFVSIACGDGGVGYAMEKLVLDKTK